MDEQQLLSRDWRTRSPPDADQEYFIDKMRMLKLRLRKIEDENRVLYRCLAEQKSDVRDALRDKCFVINNVQFEMSELKKHILVLLGVLADEQQPSDGRETLTPNHSTPYASLEPHQRQLLLANHNHQSTGMAMVPRDNGTSASVSTSPTEYDKSIWMLRNKTLEENFKKELRKVKELERQVGQLSETVHELSRDRDDLVEKNSFIEEENNIQREQITLLEDTVRDLEEVALRASQQMEDADVQTDVLGADMMAIMNENVEEIVCLVNKLAELQQRNEELEGDCKESRQSLAELRSDFHERGRLMSELENELNGLKLRDRSSECGHTIVVGRKESEELEEENVAVGDANLCSVFLSPSSSRSGSSNSTNSGDFDDEDAEESGISTLDEPTGARQTEVRKFVRKLRIRRRRLHDHYRTSM